jgi:GTPase-associated protein 1, N-terminal domain type 2
MAWQLIFTSIPRGLQAGRSGYCTAARHKEIRERLVYEIERVSQYDIGQHQGAPPIIYTYRSLVTGSANVYLLTRIVDAGADYTGRTNYLAHHLVFTEAEVAQCPFTPAEILYNFPWRDAWNEKEARYFEDQELVAAADPFGGVAIKPFRLPASRWGHLSGDDACAALLYAPDSGDPANVIIVAPKEDSKQRDLLPLFGESLRILEPTTEKTPARWRVPFTTHLQSTDSLSDFQWIGVSPDSPRLKAPGKRAVIDLTQPNCAGQYSDRLLSVRHLAEMAIAEIARTNAPASEQDHLRDVQETIPAAVVATEANAPDSVVAAQATISQATDLPAYDSEDTMPPNPTTDSGAIHADVQNGVPPELQIPTPESQAAVSQRSEQIAPYSFAPKTELRPSHPEPTLTKESSSKASAKRGNSKRLPRTYFLSIIAAALMVLCVAIGGFYFYVTKKHRETAPTDIDRILNETNFSQEVHAQLNKAVPTDLGMTVAKTAKNLWRMAETADFNEMRSLPSKDLVELRKNNQFNIPREINILDQSLPAIAEAYESLKTLQSENDKALAQIKTQQKKAHELIESLPHGKDDTFNSMKQAIEDLAKSKIEVVNQTQTNKRREAIATLETFIKNGPKSDQTPAQLEAKLNSIRAHADDADAKEIIKASDQLLTNWKLVEKPKLTSEEHQEINSIFLGKNNEPEWLIKKANKSRESPAVVAPTTKAQPEAVTLNPKCLVLYYFKDNADLKYPNGLDFGLVRVLLYISGKKEEEVRPIETNNETLGIDDIPFFSVKDKILTAATTAPKLPYRLTIKRGDTEMVRIYVGWPAKGEVIPENPGIALTLSPDGEISGALPELVPPVELSYRLGFYEANGMRTLEVIDRKCQRQHFKDLINKNIRTKEEVLKTSKTQANVLAQAAPDGKEMGNEAVAVAAKFDEIRNNEPKGTPHPLQGLREAGASLANAASDIDKTKIAEKLHSILAELLNGPHSKNNSPQHIALDKLKSASFRFKTELAVRVVKINTNRAETDAVQREIDDLKASPFLHRLPPGKYELYVKLFNSEAMIKVKTFNVGASNP